MLWIKKIWDWCLKNWKALGIALGGLIAYLAGSKRQKDKNTDNTILLDQSIKEIEVIERKRKEEARKIIKAELKYNQALKDLEKKYDDENSDLIREKDHIYKQMLTRVKDDPQKLDDFLKVMGINEVKK